MGFNEFKSILSILDEYDAIDQIKIIKEIILSIFEIPEDKIDKNKTNLNELEDGTIKISLFSLGNNININFYIDNNSVISITIGDIHVEYLFQQPILNLTDLNRLRQTIDDLLTAEIEETIIFANGTPIKVKYNIPYLLEGQLKNYKISSVVNFNIFDKKEIINKNYNSWK
jgi:hypothetical protein